MNISIERNVLLKAVANTHSVVQRRNTVPILANLLLEADGGETKISATDFDIEVVDRAVGQVNRPGSTTVAANLFYEIVRKIPDGALIDLNVDEKTGRLDVSAGRSRFSLATLPAQDFPVMAGSEYSCSFIVPVRDLRRLLDKTKFAISTEETRYYLNGVYLHVAEDEGGRFLRCVATDGHRLARADAPPPEGSEDMKGVIVPRKTVLEVLKLIDDDDDKVAVSVSDTKVRFASASATVTSRVIEGKFPDYARVIPQNNDKRLEVDAADFARAVDRVATVASDKTNIVKMLVETDKVTLSVNDPDAGTAEEELAAAYSGENIGAGFGAKLVQEVAEQVDQETMVFLFDTPSEPVVVREGTDSSTLYVIMPSRI